LRIKYLRANWIAGIITLAKTYRKCLRFFLAYLLIC
jgi:hypothetical protein